MNENDSPKKNKLFSWDRKELLYGFIVIFLLLTVYQTGQIATFEMLQKVDHDCPGIQVTFASPYGIGYLNVSKGLAPNLTYIPNTSFVAP
jgi:hypothetical protein